MRLLLTLLKNTITITITITITNTNTNTMFTTLSGYGLDSTCLFKIQKFEFNDTYEYFIINLESVNFYTDEERLKMLRDFLVTFDSVSSKGFVTDYDLTKYPIIAEILPLFSDCDKDDSYIRGVCSMESYKWLYNLVLLNLYLFCLDCIKTPEKVYLDTLTEFQILAKELFERLDTSIRFHLQKRGISIKENVYTGFDTEYVQQTPIENRLVSSQLAVGCKTVIHIPKHNSYKLSKLDEITNKITPLSKASNGFNFAKVESSIKLCVSKVRELRYGKYDFHMLVITESLKIIKGLKYYEADDSTVFSLPRSAIQPYITFGNSFSFSEMLEISSSLSQPLCERLGLVLMQLLESVASKGFNLELGLNCMLSEMYKTFELYDELEVMGNDSDKVLVYQTNETRMVKKGEKRVRRIVKKLPDAVSITITKTYYIIGHMTSADLGQLSDFNTIKEDLSIVNGSFVTLGKALTVTGRNVHVRDTMLLAPGGSKGLAAVGSMYPNFPKLTISQDDLENMQGYLDRDKERFVEYALRDAVITLIHAGWMEDFNFMIGGSGVPVSLSSIGRRYVKSIWSESKYPGYQVSSKYLLGDVSKSMTPKGLHALKDVGYVLPYYIANYKGGRNECFMFGVDKSNV
jgi:hypothetical protein